MKDLRMNGECWRKYDRVQNIELYEEVYSERREKHEGDFEFDFCDGSEMFKATGFEKMW